MQAYSVCRLCSNTENLIPIFDNRIERTRAEALRQSIRLATGLDIREDDVVSKMVCHRCCEIAVKLHKYRANAVSNDKLLKEQCGQTYVPPATDQDELRRLSAQILTSNGKMFATPYGKQPDGRLLLVDPKTSVSHEALELLNVCIKPEPVEGSSVQKPVPYKHNSVKDLYRQYPGIILPESVYKCHIAPVVTLDESEVKNWAEEEFKWMQQKLSLAKFIIQKVGEPNMNDNNAETKPQQNGIAPAEIEPQQNGTIIAKKRPGPKSKTLDVQINNLPPGVHVSKRPGPKSRTINVMPEPTGRIIETAGTVVNATTAAPKQVTLDNYVTYRPGPKSRKPDLAIQPVLPKPMVHKSIPKSTVQISETKPVVSTLLSKFFLNESQSANAVGTPKTLSNKIQQAKEIKKSEVAKDHFKLRIERPSTSAQNGMVDSDDTDEDFDIGSAFMDNGDHDSSSSSDGVERSGITRKRILNRIRTPTRPQNNGRRSQRLTGKTVSSVENDTQGSDSDSCDLETRRKRSSKPDISETKIENRSLRSKKRSSSIDSSRSDESAKRRRINTRGENNKIDLKTKIDRAETPSKPEGSKVDVNKFDDLKSKNHVEPVKTRTVKQGTLKSGSHKLDEHKSANVSKDDLSKRSKVDTNKGLKSLRERKDRTKSVSSDKMSSDKQDTSKPSESDKKVLVSTPVPQKPKENAPSLLIGKMQKIYMCHTCCKLFDTNKELSDHQKAHLICRYCKFRMKNLDTLKKHQEENCRMKDKPEEPEKSEPPHQLQQSQQPEQPQQSQQPEQPQQQPTLKLTKVDKIKSIVKKYSSAFDEKKADGIKVDHSQSLPKNSEAKSHPTPLLQPTPTTLQPTSQKQLLKEGIKTEILCISDESDDDVQYLDPANEVDLLPKSFLELPLSGLTESDMIRSLFAKHLKAGVSKYQRTTQTFLPRATDVKYTNSNLIVLESLFDQLYTYKIPVQLEIKPKISARFIGQQTTPPKTNIECWAHIKAIIVRKPTYKPIAISPKPVWIAPAKFQTPATTTQTGGVLNPSQTTTTTTSNITSSTKPRSSPSIASKTPTLLSSNSSNTSGALLPTTPAAIVLPSNISQPNTNTIILNNLLNTSPSVPPNAPLLTDSNLFLSANNSFLSTVNGQEKSPPSLISLLTSSAPTTNMTTTLIQTSNNGTLFMQNGLQSNSTTIIQTPNNATLIHTPNTAMIQTANTTAFITPDSTASFTERNLLSTTNAIATNSVSSSTPAQNSMVLMQTLPQIQSPTVISNNQSSMSTINSNNVLFQTPTEQIYQISNASANVNKVVVFSNTLANGLQQNMPLYATPYLNNIQPSTVSIEEIEDNPSGSNGAVTGMQNKTTLRIKPSWELY